MTVKKAFVCLLFTCVYLPLLSAAVGIGVQGDAAVRSELPSGTDGAFPCGASLTLATDTLPWVFAVQARLNPLYIGFTADNWVVYQPLGRAASWFAFWGISGGGELEDACGINTGARLGVGANLFLFRRHLELYALAAWNPTFGVNLTPDDSDERLFVQPLFFPASAGLRVWF